MSEYSSRLYRYAPCASLRRASAKPAFYRMCTAYIAPYATFGNHPHRDSDLCVVYAQTTPPPSPSLPTLDAAILMTCALSHYYHIELLERINQEETV